MPRVPAVAASPDVLDVIDRRVQKVLVYDLERTIDDLFHTVSTVVGTRAVPCYSGLAFIELAASLVSDGQHLP